MATLLIIDDDSTVREILQDLLSATHECHTADRAEQAIEYLQIETYDVIVTDISMPGLGGFELVKRIKENHPATPVIVISGQLEMEDESFTGLGAFAFFSKPFLLEEVEDAIVRAIAYHQTMGEQIRSGS